MPWPYSRCTVTLWSPVRRPHPPAPGPRVRSSLPPTGVSARSTVCLSLLAADSYLWTGTPHSGSLGQPLPTCVLQHLGFSQAELQPHWFVRGCVSSRAAKGRADAFSGRHGGLTELAEEGEGGHGGMDSGPREWLPTVSGLPGAGLTPFLPHKDLSSTGPPPPLPSSPAVLRSSRVGVPGDRAGTHAHTPHRHGSEPNGLPSPSWDSSPTAPRCLRQSQEFSVTATLKKRAKALIWAFRPERGAAPPSCRELSGLLLLHAPPPARTGLLWRGVPPRAVEQSHIQGKVG